MTNQTPDSASPINMVTASFVDIADTPELLLSRFVKGNESAFEQLVEQVGERLFAYIYRYINNYHSAEEVYQTVLLKVACNAAAFSGDDGFMAWLYRIAYNSVIDCLRREKRQQPTTDQFDNLASDPSPGPERIAQLREISQRVTNAVQKLPEEQRQVFLLREEAGLTYDEIARIVGSNRDTVKSRMRYALRFLQRILSDLNPQNREKIVEFDIKQEADPFDLPEG